MSVSSMLDDFESRKNVNHDGDQIIVDEAAWYSTWKALIPDDLSPSLIALTGGLHATAPPWIFISGYQGAIRQVFPEIPKGGWAAFAASEDQTDITANPPMRIVNTDHAQALQGTKSWVAQSRHVDHLVVTALTQSDTLASVIVNRHRDGVVLTHRDQPGFLPALSQGFARLESVSIDEKDLLTTPRTKEFMKNESKFVMLSCAASMFANLTHCTDLKPDLPAVLKQEGPTVDTIPELQIKLRALIIKLATACENASLTITELAIMDKELQTSFLSYEKLFDFSQDKTWKSDRKIFSLYSAGIQKRAAKQLEEKGH